MISRKKLEEQLKRINFHHKGWGRTEVDELCNILMPDEEIEECVNGYYEAGFALLVTTKTRLLLVDKKPLGYLTIEDMRFDMINEFDLHRRLMGAQIRVSAGSKTLHFTSLNQVRLRRLLNYVQARMTQIKKDQDDHQMQQKQHLEEMNEQLRLYLMAAHKQQFLDQAHAISDGHAYGQPSTPQQPYQYPVAMQMQQHMPQQMPPQQAYQQPPQQQPASPFEQVASSVFDQQISGQQEVNPQPRPKPQDTPEHAAAAPSPQRPMAHILTSVPKYSQQALQAAEQMVLTPQQVGLAAARRVVPIISAYTRLPLMSQRRRYRTAPTQGSLAQ